MGCNRKTTYCDLAESEKRALVKGESFVDLKLGRLGDSETGLPNRCIDQTVSLMDPFSSPGGSSKRARILSGGAQVVSCLVDGCKADLGKCRDYHRRHKVCEMHSKTSRVTIGGHEQRFCQQCSRFHSLGEFDEGKRSCRKRLEGHNRRRRKPQPEPLPVNPGNFLSASQGSRFLPFSSHQVTPATSMANTFWPGSVTSESNPTVYSSSVSSSCSSNTYRGRQFPFLQVPEPNPVLTGPSSSGHMLNHDGSSNNDNKNHKMFCYEINQVVDSDRALSLLSSSPADTSDMGLGRIMHPIPSTLARPMQLDGFSPFSSTHTQGFQRQPGGSGLFSDTRSNNSLCQDVFQNRLDGSSAREGYQTLSFSWE